MSSEASNFVKSPDGACNVILRTVDLKTGKAVPYVPLREQRAFHESQAKYRACIGGLGWGKSAACNIETICSALLYPGSHNAVLRWDQSSLKDTTWILLRQIIAASNLDPLIKRETNSLQGSLIEFTNGSIIQGFHAKSWKKLGGLSLSSFFIDEVSECPDDEVFNQLCARVDRHHMGPNRGWICGLGDGHNWYWRTFKQQKLYNHELFEGTTFDNPFLRDNYAEDMVARYGPERAQVMVYGSFDMVEGRLFEMFDERTHVISRGQIKIPADWPRYAAIDPGYNPDPATMLRIVVDKWGNIIIECEYLRHERVTEQWSQDILAVNQDHPPHWYVIDNSAYRETHLSSQSVADTARRCGIAPLRPAANTAGYIDQAVALTRSMLTPMEGRIHPVTGKTGCYPQLYILDDCPHTIREMKAFRMRKSGAASALHGIKLPDHDHDTTDCWLFLALEPLQPAPEDAKPPISPFWEELYRLQNVREPAPYLHQISRIRR